MARVKTLSTTGDVQVLLTIRKFCSNAYGVDPGFHAAKALVVSMQQDRATIERLESDQRTRSAAGLDQ